MTATPFFDFLNTILNDDEKVRLLPALMQDPFIFAGLQSPEAIQNLMRARELIKENLVPGVLALAAVYPDLLDGVLKAGKLPTELLEKAMSTYENTKQRCSLPESLETAADLALALIEKRKIVSHWKLVMNDVFRNHASHSESDTAACWKTAILIASQVDPHREEIYEALAQPGGSKVQEAIFFHCVLAQPVTAEEKIRQAAYAFANHNEAEQVRALEFIVQQAGQSMAEGTAKAMLAARNDLPFTTVSTTEVWSNPVEHLNQAARFQNLGIIAQTASDNDKALAYINAANGIIDKFKTGLDIQKIGALVHKEQKELRETAALGILQQNPGDKAVLSELLMAIEPDEDGAVISTVRAEGNPALDFAKTKSIETAGNAALAREAAAQAFKSLEKNPAVAAPRFSRSFSLEKVFNLLVHFDLPEEAAGVARILLEQSPADLELVQKSAPIFFKTGDYDKALDLYQSIEFLNPAAVDVKRTKAMIFEKLGEDSQAFEAWKAVTNLSTPAMDDDLLHMANTANRLGDTEAAIQAASEVQESSSVYGKALIAKGRSYQLMGDHHQAIENLAKAIEMEVDDEEPWLALADLYAETGELERSIDTLKAARSVFPEAKEIPYELAKKLLAKNSPSEALSLLTDLTYRNPDFMPGQVLTVKTMKALNHEGVDAKIDDLSARFPDSPEINYLKGQQYLKNGFRHEARNVLSKAVAAGSPQPEWLAAFADAFAGEDYERVKIQGKTSDQDLLSAQNALDRSGIAGVDPLAASVNAEMLLEKGKAEEAFKSIAELESKRVSPDSDWYWRLQAGMARAATLLGKFDVALASIQEAINQRPGLSGLQQILADVHKASGDTLAAVEAANQVLLIAPDIVENVLWFANFLTGLGHPEEAEKELQKAVTRKPEEIKYRLALANLLAQSDRETELKQALGSVEVMKKANLEEEDIVQAAGLYLRTNDLSSAVSLLKERIDQNPDSIQAKLDLAGLLVRRNQTDQAIEILGGDLAGGKASVLRLFQAQIYYAQSDFTSAKNSLSAIGMHEGLNLDEFQSKFLPDSWSVLFQQPEPVDFLQAEIEFALGEFKDAAGHAQASLVRTPENSWMTFLQRQSDLGLGIEQELKPAQIARNLPGIVAYTLAQESLDAGEIGQALQLINEIKQGQDEEWEGAIRTQAAAIRGELIEADVNASNVDLSTYATKNWEKAEEIVKVRSLIFSNLARWQWNDALSIAGNLFHSASTNKANTALYLKAIVTTLENYQSNSELGVKVHTPSQENLVKGKSELPELQSMLEGCTLSEAKRWLLRGKLILEPNAANVRALAMITPQPGDIGAMMSALHAMGDDATAIQVARKYESHPQVLAKMAKCLESTDLPKALAALSRSLQIIEAQPDVWVARSMLEEKLGEKENAIQSMENALSYWPDETEWQIRTAQLWQDAGDVKKAVAHLKTATGQEQQSPDLQYRIGSAYLSLGRSNEAIQMLETASSGDMNRSDILETLADAYYRGGNIEKALKVAEQASVANPFTVKPLLLTGEIALEKGETSKALDYARQAISRNEKNADAVTFLAKVLLKKGDKSQALAALEKAAASEEATLDLMLKHAHLVREIKGAADSRSIFEGLVSKYPQNIELLKLLAESQLECGDKVAAEETARHSLRLDAGQPELHGFLGKLKLENGNLDLAIHHFSEQISLDKEQLSGYLSLAKVYQQQREFHKALDTLQQAIDANPQDARAFVAAAGLLKEAKDYASAETMLRKASGIDPNDVNIKRQLGAVIALNLVHKSQQESSKL